MPRRAPAAALAVADMIEARYRIEEHCIADRVLTLLEEREAVSMREICEGAMTDTITLFRVLRELTKQGMVRRLRPIYPPDSDRYRKNWYIENTFFRPRGSADSRYRWQQTFYEGSTGRIPTPYQHQGRNHQHA